ncbi:MAG: hypothetical protein KA007_01855 [Candidatus Pacebacteria bacterium]|nr:hypothetical protein [Candidatus Paceibacterota bacterium]
MNLKKSLFFFVLFINCSFPLYGMDEENKKSLPVSLSCGRNDVSVEPQGKGFTVSTIKDMKKISFYLKNDSFDLKTKDEIEIKFTLKVPNEEGCEIQIRTTDAKPKLLWKETYPSIKGGTLTKTEKYIFSEPEGKNVCLWLRFLDIQTPFNFTFIENLETSVKKK